MRIHEYLMADGSPPSGAIYEDPEDDVVQNDDDVNRREKATFQYLDPGEVIKDEEEENQDQDVVRLTREEYQQLQKAREGGGVDGMKELLTQVLNRPAQIVQVPAQAQTQAEESEEEFDSKIAETLWDEKQGPKSIRAIAKRELRGVASELAAELRETRKELLRNNPSTGPIFDKYRDEIEARFQSLPRNQQVLPRVYDMIFEEVRTRHVSDIAEDLVAQKLREKGFDPETMERIEPETPTKSVSRNTPSARTTVSRGHSGGQSSPSYRIDDAVRRRAQELTLDPESYIRWAADKVSEQERLKKYRGGK